MKERKAEEKSFRKNNVGSTNFLVIARLKKTEVFKSKTTLPYFKPFPSQTVIPFWRSCPGEGPTALPNT